MFTLYAISPKLTVLMVTVIPAVIGVGTIMGSGLRALSKAAQDQVCVNHGLITKGMQNISIDNLFLTSS